MAEIATYTCSNRQCLLTMMLSSDFPVWHQDTPREIKSLCLTPARLRYVVGFHSDAFCHECRKISRKSENGSCSLCGATGVREEQAGATCPQCVKGFFRMTALSIY